MYDCVQGGRGGGLILSISVRSYYVDDPLGDFILEIFNQHQKAQLEKSWNLIDNSYALETWHRVDLIVI